LKKISFPLYLSFLLLLPAANLALRYFSFPNTIFLIGFRFYGVTLAAAVILYFSGLKENFKTVLMYSSFKKVLRHFFFALLPGLIITGVLFALKKIEIGDPDYFYELGLSSIVDYPIYFVWNIPQLFLLFVVLRSIEDSFKLKILPNVFFLLILFSPELATFPKFALDFLSLPSLFFAILAVILFVHKKTNSLPFILFFFTSLWFYLLLFGSKCEMLLQTFLAKTYTEWDGFFVLDKKFVPFVPVAFFLLSTIIALSLKKENSK